MLPINHLLRAARRLHEAWHKAALTVTTFDLQHLLGRLEQRYQAIQQARRRLDKARQGQLSLIQPDLQKQLLAQTRQLCDAGTHLLDQVELSMLTVPSERFLVDELRQIEADFVELTIDWNGKAVCAATEPITLGGIYLGPFALRFFWERLEEAVDHYCFDVVALDPQTSLLNEDVTHPHVKNNKVCPGDASKLLGHALDQGRLADAFCLVRSLLLTYNPRSPYVPLKGWAGTPCHDCDCSVAADELSCCPGCGNDYCDECLSLCPACRHTRCSGCLEDCTVCQQEFCGNCLTRTAASRRRCCPACRRSCPNCNAVFAKDEAVEASGLCPPCRTRATGTTNSATGNAAAGTAPSSPPVESPHAPSSGSLEPAPAGPTPD
jgi:hypothetical protein